MVDHGRREAAAEPVRPHRLRRPRHRQLNSSPLWTVRADRAPTLADPYPAPGGDIGTNVAYARRVADTCAKNAVAYLPYLDTKSVAQDMDRIRQALGARQLNYYRTSYGTYRGAVYASMFPRNTGKIVLDSSTLCRRSSRSRRPTPSSLP
ncbi:hypothetical protein [Amycolatopsis sp. NPDC050768]|uniref:hypothetical protein n=1 Tax=Amycolatopsis sp. NPDC050768 TaxID=3154839 RepID=UPI0033CD4894